jgi:diguanylate cyclase (GGDEF)-like protein
LLVDLDHFKDANDLYGHPTGDQLLREAASRLKACVRVTDPPARLGGDEFAIIVGGLKFPVSAAVVADKIIAKLSAPFWVDTSEVYLGASIGITLYPSDADNGDDLLRNADMALYRAKRQGRNTYAFYAKEMAEQVERRKLIERDLRRALDKGGLDLFFQPQINIVDGRVTGAEALLRWRHKTLGTIPPDELVGVAETSGLIFSLDMWVLRQACAETRYWREAGLPTVTTAVNLSPTHFRRGDFGETVVHVCEEYGLDLSLLELEVTECAFLQAEEKSSVESLHWLREQGVQVSIDDFGMGYSSFGRLQSLPVNAVKIDRSFVAGISKDPSAEHFVRAIIGLAQLLNLRVVAEGVEEAAQLNFLRQEECDCAQGYYFSAPLPAEAFREFLRRNLANEQRLN